MTPDKVSLAAPTWSASVQPLEVRDQAGDHFSLGEAERVNLRSFDVVLLRQDPPFDLGYITNTHLLERIHPHTLVVNDPASVRNAPEKLFVMDFADLMPPTLISRDKDEINAFRDEHGAVVMKPLHGHGGAAVFRVAAAGHEFRLALRHVRGHLPRALGDPALPSRGEARRQAHHSGRWRIRRRGQSRAGGRRSALQHGARRRRGGDRPDAARA